jgi:hypothetical protein
MKRVLWFMAIFMNISFAIIFISCNDKKATQQVYYYYPKTNVYYDVAGSKYFYSVNGGQSWDSVSRLSNKEPATLGNHETIYSTSAQVYKENEAHRKKYNGRLFLLASVEGRVNEVDSGAAERAVIRPGYHRKTAAKRSIGKNKPAKKPLKDFFKKIFGKSKDR